MKHPRTFNQLALAALAAVSLSLPVLAAQSSHNSGLSQAETAPVAAFQEPMGGQFGGTTLGSELEDGGSNDPMIGMDPAYQDRDFNDADDDDRSDPGALSAVMFLLMAAGLGGGILAMHLSRSDTATGTHEYL